MGKIGIQGASVREEYERAGRELVRTVTTPDGARFYSAVPITNGVPTEVGVDQAFDSEWLRAGVPLQSARNPRDEVTVVDLFCGLGGMSIGLDEACRALSLKMRHVWAADVDPTARRIFERHHPGVEVDAQPIESRLDGALGSKPTPEEQKLKEEFGRVSIVVGGPPCQGHSNLNNHTRRRDPKNALYLRMARVAEVLEPRHLIVENVPGVQHDKGGVMAQARAHLEPLGYVADNKVIRAEKLGVAQTRHRMFLVASLRSGHSDSLDLAAMLERHCVEERDFEWACCDLHAEPGGSFDSASVPKPETKKRIDWLFDRDAYDLDDEQRPDCHRLKPHRYQAVYGRMYPNRPAPTITTGFLVMGQGRFVHPRERRTITPHEGARLQFLPDWLDIPQDLWRKDYATLIGNAVPPKLTYILGLELLTR